MKTPQHVGSQSALKVNNKRQVLYTDIKIGLAGIVFLVFGVITIAEKLNFWTHNVHDLIGGIAIGVGGFLMSFSILLLCIDIPRYQKEVMISEFRSNDISHKNRCL
jgi:hypothetical protein